MIQAKVSFIVGEKFWQGCQSGLWRVQGRHMRNLISFTKFFTFSLISGFSEQKNVNLAKKGFGRVVKAAFHVSRGDLGNQFSINCSNFWISFGFDEFTSPILRKNLGKFHRTLLQVSRGGFWGKFSLKKLST